MLLFKEKGKKKDNIPINIDHKHKEIIKTLENQKTELDELYSLYKSKKELYESIEQIPNNIITDEQIDKKFALKIELDQLEKNINFIQNENSTTNYFVRTGHILFNYYNKINQVSETTEIDNQNPFSKSILDYFKGNSKRETTDNVDKKVENVDTSAKKRDKRVMTKTEMLDKYMNIVDSSCITDRDREEDIEICKKCNEQKLFVYAEGLIVCQKCGDQDYVFIDCDKPSYKEPPKEIANIAYKRINHFNEHISQFQGKESTEIRPEIYEAIKLELKKERIMDLSSLTSQKIREILRKLDLSKYYEHIPHIINHLNNIPPPNLTKNQEKTLRVMFKEIQIPFMKYCPSDRQNFSSYPYILHKFCELLEWDHLLPCFPLLKSREKLQEADELWEKICNDLGWEFYKSI